MEQGPGLPLPITRAELGVGAPDVQFATAPDMDRGCYCIRLALNVSAASGLMLKQIMKHEWRNLGADRTLWAIAILLAATIGYGLYNGMAWASFQNDTLQAIAREEYERLESVKTGIVDAEARHTKPNSFSDPRSATALGRTMGLRYASMPPGPLAAFAIGQSDLYPYYFKVSTSSKQTFLNNDEIEHPVHLMSGRFDLAFVILYLYPLIILALSYNVISAEKEAGTLALTLSQPIALYKLVAGKIGLRFLFVLAIAAGLSIAGMIGGGARFATEGTGVRLLLWFGVVALYGAFWFALAAMVNAFGASSATNAIALSGLWLAFVLLIPSLLNVGVKSLHPVPSRVELIQAMREASGEASAKGSQLLSKYFEDHPELAGEKTNTADFGVVTLVTQEEIDRRIQPVLNRFDEQLEQQQAMVDRYRFLSPAVIAQATLFDIAGTSAHRYKHFVRLSDDFHRTWRSYFAPLIVKNENINPSEVDRFPRFHFAEEPFNRVVTRASSGLWGLTIPTALLSVFAWLALRRFPVTG
jgi:ABC-2 type transport system permease protein